MKKDCTNTETFLKELQRMMIGMDVDTLKLNCKIFCVADVTAYIEEVQKWSDEHKEKTYAEDFLEKFPKARTSKGSDSIPIISGICQQVVYGTNQNCGKLNCSTCWNTVKGETPKSGSGKKL